MPVEFVNIREQCAWVHSDNPAEATRKAIEIIRSGVLRAQGALPSMRLERPISQSVLILSTGLSSLATAMSLASQAYPVSLIYKSGLKKTKEKEASLLKDFEKSGGYFMSWPKRISINGVPGDYEAVLEGSSETANVKVGAVIADSGAVDKILAQADTSFKESLVGHIFGWYRNPDNRRILDFALREFALGDPTGIYIVPSNPSEPPEKQVIEGQALAARVLSYLRQGVLKARITAVNIDRQLCRGCGDCTAVCPYIEMKVSGQGTAYAAVDPMLCLGCGACISSCPTGAMTQPVQSDLGIINTLEALLARPGKVGVTT
jgi:ferredoxin